MRTAYTPAAFAFLTVEFIARNLPQIDSSYRIAFKVKLASINLACTLNGAVESQNHRFNETKRGPAILYASHGRSKVFLDSLTYRLVLFLTKNLDRTQVDFATFRSLVALIIRWRNISLDPIPFPKRDSASKLERLEWDWIQPSEITVLVYSSHANGFGVPTTILWHRSTQNQNLLT